MSNRPASYSLLEWFLFIVLGLLTLVAGYLSFEVYYTTTERADMRNDHMEANSIMHGIFNINNWREDIRTIVVDQVEDFELTDSQDSLMRVQINQLLHKMIDRAQVEIAQEDGPIRGRITRWAVNMAVDWENMHQNVPGFTETIMEELTSEESKERLKMLTLDKFNELANQIYDDSLATAMQRIYTKYETDNLAEMNEVINRKADRLEQKGQRDTYIIIGILLLFGLLCAFATYRKPKWRRPVFSLSVVLGLVVLLGGLATPMIEIDARISYVDFTLLSHHIEYTEQMIFYRSKSILQVVGIMMESARWDSKAVGFLILAFSVILPILKLVSTQFHLYGPKFIGQNVVVKWLALKSGKWSMADVMVVAIFMSFVGFDGILDNQLKLVERDTEMVTSLSTNLTNLQPGFILFVGYVLYGLVLAALLKVIVAREKTESPTAEGQNQA